MATLLLRHPVLSYLILAFAISWSIWFAIPLVSGGNWTTIKIMVAIGMGPGLAAVFLDRFRGTAGPIDGRWLRNFSLVTLAVAAINVSSLVTGDARLASELATAEAPGLTAAGLVAAILAASVCGFIFASAAASRSPALSSIARWRAPLRWWVIAGLLPATLLTISYAIALLIGEELPDPIRGGMPALAWSAFIARSILFTLLVVGIGEEPGWRGWMLPELQKRFSPLLSSIIVGAVWGFWHFPLFINGAYPGPPDAVVEYIFLGPLVGLLFTWVYNRTGGNLLLAIVLHTAVNNSQRVLPTTTLYPVLIVGVIVAVVFSDRMWRRRANGDDAANAPVAVAAAP